MRAEKFAGKNRKRMKATLVFFLFLSQGGAVTVGGDDGRTKVSQLPTRIAGEYRGWLDCCFDDLYSE